IGGLALWRHRFAQLDARALQSVLLDPLFDDAKDMLAAREQMKDTEVRHLPVFDSRRAADFVWRSRCAHFVAGTDQAYAECSVVANARFRHVEVALFEDL